MSGEYGVKETKEVLNLIKVIALSIVAEGKKDGWQPKDALAFLKSPHLEAAVSAAVAGIEQVPAELSDIGVLDGIDLGRYAYGVMDEVLDALKGVVVLKAKA
jgi:hypothetical protein